MKDRISATHRNLDPGPPCKPLRGAEANVDSMGRLSLCCNLSGFRGASAHDDVVAALRTESLGQALPHDEDVIVARGDGIEARVPDLAQLSLDPVPFDSAAGRARNGKPDPGIGGLFLRQPVENEIPR